VSCGNSIEKLGGESLKKVEKALRIFTSLGILKDISSRKTFDYGQVKS
jgi:hypothetical protein